MPKLRAVYALRQFCCLFAIHVSAVYFAPLPIAEFTPLAPYAAKQCRRTPPADAHFFERDTPPMQRRHERRHAAALRA